MPRDGDTPRDEERYYLHELFDVDAATTQPTASIFAQPANSAGIVNQIRHSAMPSIIERQRTLTTIMARRGQSGFRTRILNAFQNQCVITGERIGEVLEAAHIIPFNQGGDDTEANGLCLRVDVHRLFDAGHLRIRSTGELLFSDAMRASHTYRHFQPKVVLPPFVNPVNVDWRDRYL